MKYHRLDGSPEAIAHFKRLDAWAAKQGIRFTLWPGRDDWTFDSGSVAIAKALSEAKRVGSYVPVYQLSSEYPELVAFEICVATSDGRIERKR